MIETPKKHGAVEIISPERLKNPEKICLATCVHFPDWQPGGKDSLSQARRRAVLVAAETKGIEVIIMTEAEKISLPTVSNISRIVQPIINKEADLDIPERNLGKKREDYPDFQHQSEIRANNLLNTIMVKAGLRKENEAPLDMFGGIRVFGWDLYPLFLTRWQVRAEKQSAFRQTFKSVDFDQWSNAIIAPVLLALGLGKKVISTPIDYSHPEMQTSFEEKHQEEYLQKRWLQLHQITVETAEEARFLKELGKQEISLQDVLDYRIDLKQIDLPDKVRVVLRQPV
jgi:hypothetical protein